MLDQARQAAAASDWNLALARLTDFLVQHPGNPEGLLLQGDILLRLGKLIDARNAITEALAAIPSEHPAYVNRTLQLALISSRLSEHAKCTELATAVLGEIEDHLLALALTTTSLFRQGNSDRCAATAERLFLALLRNDPAQIQGQFGLVAQAIYSGVSLTTARGALERYQTLSLVVSREGLAPLAEHAGIHFSLAMLQEMSGNYADALSRYQQGNHILRQESHYNVTVDLQRFERMQSLFASRLPGDVIRPAGSSNTPRVCFVVGMPRSGTTLCEQILDAHSRVVGMGELSALNQALIEAGARTQSMGKSLEDSATYNEEFFTRVRQGYLAKIELPAQAEWIVDKMPANLQYLWLIAGAFPDARVIIMSRDKLPTVMSCYTTYFATGNEYSESIADCAAYYDAFEAMKKAWIPLLGEQACQIAYEELTSNPAVHISRVLEFLDLQAEDACFSPHQSQRVALTASQLQVARPIYSTGNARWEKYRTVLGESLHFFE